MEGNGTRNRFMELTWVQVTWTRANQLPGQANIFGPKVRWQEYLGKV